MRFSLSQTILLLVPVVFGAGQLPLTKNNGIQWKQMTSMNGAPFEAGSSKLGHEDFEIMECKRISVDWPVGDDSWKSAGTGELYNIISEYKLHDNGWSAWSWRLDVRYPMYVGTFQFYDQSGDCYDLSVAAGGDHYIRYNSDSPKIIRVGYGGSCSDCKRR